jgi:hypothetical protein
MVLVAIWVAVCCWCRLSLPHASSGGLGCCVLAGMGGTRALLLVAAHNKVQCVTVKCTRLEATYTGVAAVRTLHTRFCWLGWVL